MVLIDQVQKTPILKTFASNYLILPSLIQFGWRVWTAGKVEFDHKIRQLEKMVKVNPGVLRDYRPRIRLYSHIDQILMVWNSTLLGRNWNAGEREACQLLTGLIPFYDDHFDQKRLHDHRESLLQAPSARDPWRVDLCKKALQAILPAIRDKDQFLSILDLVHQSQVESLAQLDPEVSKEHLKRITAHKGGYSTLLYRSIWGNRIEPNEHRAWYELGGLLQLGNDIFDVYQDREAGIYTLATRAHDIGEVRQLFEKQVLTTATCFSRTEYPTANKTELLQQIMFICGRVMVCLDHLERGQSLRGGVLEVHKLTRSELVCDMEKPANFIKGLQYSLIDLAKVNPVQLPQEADMYFDLNFRP